MSNIPLKYRTATLDDCPDLPFALVVGLRVWSADPHGSLFLHGEPGSGKTWSAVAILKEQRERLFISEPDYLDHRRKRMSGERTWDLGHHPIWPSEVWGEHPRFMLLDDFCSTRLTDWGKAEMARLIDKRYTLDLPTIVTCNLDLDAVTQQIDARTASRLAEGQVHGFPAKDLRQVGSLAQIREGRV